MTDTARRSALESKANSLRQASESLIARVADRAMKDLIRRQVLHQVDDVQGFFLGDAGTRPSSTPNETLWLDLAEIILRGAEEQFRSLSTTIDKYGGPEKVRVHG